MIRNGHVCHQSQHGNARDQHSGDEDDSKSIFTITLYDNMGATMEAIVNIDKSTLDI